MEERTQKRGRVMEENGGRVLSKTFLKIASYNILASGFTSPFKNTPSQDLQWPLRRKRIIDILISLSADVICLQELQSSTRGWGRAISGKDLDGHDHAQQMRILLASAGYDGCYQVVDDDARSSDSAAKNDIAWTPGKDTKRNTAWPVEGFPGSRIGNAIFWKPSTWKCVAQHPVLFSSVFMDLTKAKGDQKAWLQVKGMQCALIVLLKRNVENGPLICICNVHLPVPGNVKKAALQVQYAEALVVEAETMLRDLYLLNSVPIIITGDFNSTQPGYKDGSVELNEHEGSPVYQLFSKGSLEGSPTLTSSEFPLPFPHPRCGSLGKFTSAYAAINGSEPRFTNFRMVYDEKLLESHLETLVKTKVEEKETVDKDPVAIEELKKKIIEQGLKDVPGETKFCATLDYIFFRQAAKATSEDTNDTLSSTSKSAPFVRPVNVTKLPTIEEAAAYCGALPSNEHPSDHVPIAAEFEVLY
jgi:mRNA deadenylase 3'-5' endonuclease subunit Ccr4